MADNLAVARDADARSADMLQAEPWLLPAELREPMSERVIQAGSRWAGIAAFAGALAAIGFWLLG